MDAGLFAHFAALRLRERMEYRGAFVLSMAAQILNYAGEYLLLFLVLQRFRVMNGWTWPQVAFLFSLDLFTYAVGASFAYSPMVELEEMVVQGTFDTVLVRPLDPLLHLAARKYNVGYLAHVLLSSIFLLWAVGRLGVTWTPATVAYLLLALVGGSCLHAAALIAAGSLTFLAARSGIMFDLYYTLKSFLAYPLTLYGVAIQWFLTLVVPLAFINFYPATLLLDKQGAIVPPAIGLVAPLVGVLALLGARRLFSAALQRYQGAGG